MHTRAFGLFASTLCIGCFLLTPLRADTYPRQPGIDVLHYTFRVTLSDDTDEIQGETTVEVRFLNNSVTEFSLDLTSLSNGKGMVVSAVVSNGVPVRYRHESNRLHILLPIPPHEADRREFSVLYHGIPGAGLRIGANKYGERTFFSTDWPDKARQWLPTLDHPYDKATSEFIVTAPAKYQVVANGLLEEETDLGGGRRTTHWKQSVPIASWLNTIGVAQFAHRNIGAVEGIPLLTWTYPQDRAAGIVMFDDATREAMEFYIDHIGPYPYEKLADVEAAGMNGGMESATAIFYGERSVGNRPGRNLVAHEIAHQWFGDSVTEKDWDDVWLSEGFATYFALLCTEHYEGRDAFVEGLQRSRDGVFAAEKRNPGVAVVHQNLSDMSKVLNQIVYQKGAWTLHMLRGLIGTDRFWAGIRDYYRLYRDGNASTDDFRRVMEDAAGQELTWFFYQWLRPGSPVVDGEWRFNAASKRIEIELAQTQPGDPYRLPVEIGISHGDKQDMQITKIELTKKQQKFEIPSDREPGSVVLDPATWTLMNARFEKRSQAQMTK